MPRLDCPSVSTETPDLKPQTLRRLTPKASGSVHRKGSALRPWAKACQRTTLRLRSGSERLRSEARRLCFEQRVLGLVALGGFSVYRDLRPAAKKSSIRWGITTRRRRMARRSGFSHQKPTLNADFTVRELCSGGPEPRVRAASSYLRLHESSFMQP